MSGLPLPQYLIANITASLFVLLVHYAVAGLIFWRLPDSWFGLLTAFVIMFTGTAAVEDAGQVAGLLDRLSPRAIPPWPPSSRLCSLPLWSFPFFAAYKIRLTAVSTAASTTPRRRWKGLPISPATRRIWSS